MRILLDHKQPKRVAFKGMEKSMVCHQETKAESPSLHVQMQWYSPSTYGYFKGEHLNYEWTKGEVPNTVYGLSPQGWIDQEFLFSGWKKLFIPNICPVMLLLDGHSSHYIHQKLSR